MSKVVLLLLFLTTLAQAKTDAGQGIFFPKKLGEKIESYTSFPMTWWNFLTYEAKEESDLVELVILCGKLRTEGSELIGAISCGNDLTSFEPWLKAWARDESLRSARPSDAALSAELKSALAKASLPLPSQMLSILRFDPRGSYRQLQEKLAARSLVELPRVNGVFYDAEAGRALIPIKLNYRPAEVEKTAKLLDILASLSPEKFERFHFLGAHGATFTNQGLIRKEVTKVSLIGLFILGIGLLAVILLKRWPVLLVAPLVGVGVGLSALLTNLVFGSIHGLTLAFGSGIVGLAMDYGFHRAFNPQKYVARSNLFGWLTTAAVLVILMMSEIPLLRQMMFFSTMGITLAFLLIYIAHERWNWFQKVAGFSYIPTPSRPKFGLIAVLALGIPVSFFFLRPTFDIAKFNFQSPQEKALMLWLVKTTNVIPPYFTVDGVGDASQRIDRASEMQTWAKDRMRVENVASFLPRVSVQQANLATWLFPAESCEIGPMKTFAKRLPQNEQTFFEPYFNLFDCTQLKTTSNANALPAYVSDFSSRGKWLSLIFPKNDADVVAIKSQYPDATSLKEVVNIFPNTLTKELKWMIPVSIGLIFALLCVYFRNPVFSLIALIPFFTGVGLIGWAGSVFHLEVSFVSMVGIIMLCGFSVDYGIFAIDATRFPTPSSPGAWTAVIFASITTFTGFVPLLFCHHPVLVQLGQSLSLGMAGSMLGTFWGVPSAVAMVVRKGSK